MTGDPTPRAQSQSATAAKPSRRPQAVAALLLALAALALWSSSRMIWGRVLAADGLAPPRDFDVHGSDWSPWLTPLALVLLAAILAALSVRGWGLRLIAVLVALGGILAAIPAISLISDGTDSGYAARAADIPDRFQVLLITTNSWAAVVVLLGAVCAVAAGVALLRVARGAGMSSKYRTPGARREELERQMFADHRAREAAKAAGAGAATDPGPAGPGSGHGTSGTTDPAASTSGSGAGTATGETPDVSADTEPAAGPDASSAAEAPVGNERMMWDALDTGIDPTDPTDSSDESGPPSAR
ncbi:TIGR02234 family membrane protein [Gordonia soli]|uniref:TIGR02234 family membrane protein n=1 Tax=Gordonia soli NBRC 108243 TaxID=1223545 RepID=M0QNJ4_9ACTN|nr:TIGR02234 family membrane protein [Gordonia soli]GAC69974.1 hypothetical protein GS4_30_00460 [Gordonia soli NBRC 108243]